MIDPAMQRARELAAAEAFSEIQKLYYTSGGMDSHPALIALAKRERAISDAVASWWKVGGEPTAFKQFILPPTKPDPVDALADAWYDRIVQHNDGHREALRSELELAGLELREVGK